MQIWRMKPDGSEQQQITFDDFNNWFPHISPDGKMDRISLFTQEVKRMITRFTNTSTSVYACRRRKQK